MRAVKFISYKADGEAHRLWQRLYLFEETEDRYVFASLFPGITEGNGRTWSNSEPTLYICPKKRFFNVVVMFKEIGELVYYVNIASPVVRISDGEYGFIDLDLDVKMYGDKSVKLLDEDEFLENSAKYSYSTELIAICRATVEEIKKMMNSGVDPFDDESNRRMLERFSEERHK